jgi:5,10-methenyltetrahydrofolate synthetase
MTAAVPTFSEIDAQKRALRDAVLARRAALSARDRVAASEAITAKLIAHPAYARSRCVLAYASFGDEFDTTALLNHVLQSGKVLVLPRIDKSTRQLVLHQVSALSDLVAGMWGIRESRAESPLVKLAEVDFALIPGLAFDRHGGRLGYGGGYYDKLLSTAASISQTHAETPALAGLSAAFSCQIVDTVPMTPHDIYIPTIITEDEVITAHDR